MTHLLFAVECPDPDHAGSSVVRNGFSNSSAGQRYRCEQENGTRHTFTLPTEHDSLSPAADYSAPPRFYRHNAAQIAAALVAIGRGASYRQAALSTSAGSSMNGQLVADWVRAFGPVVAARAPRRWPAQAAVGAFTFQPQRGEDGLVVQLAVAAPTATSQAHVFDTKIASSRPGQWRAFYGRHPGCPDALVLRQGSEASAAALRYWPDSPPRLVDVPRWRTADVLGHGGPHQPQGASSADLAEDDLDALIGAYADSSKALFRRLSSRRGHFRRLDQVDRLLDLMRLDLNGEADVDEYAERIARGGPS
jgi:hypothetical protein